jgi:IS30 family transposase
LAESPRFRWLVARKLSQQWSPEQIAGWLRLRFPRDEAMQVSHETIYRSLFIQTRGMLKKELMAHLRTRRRITSRRLSSAIRALSCW